MCLPPLEEAAQSIEVAGNSIDPTLMQGENGQYFARVAFTGEVPESITVTNAGDNPKSVKTIAPGADQITATATL